MNSKIMTDEINEIIRERIEKYELSVDKSKSKVCVCGGGVNPYILYSGMAIESPVLPIRLDEIPSKSYWDNRKYEADWMYPHKIESMENIYKSDNSINHSRQLWKSEISKNLICESTPKLKKEKDTKTPPIGRSQDHHNRIMALNGRKR